MCTGGSRSQAGWRQTSRARAGVVAPRQHAGRVKGPRVTTAAAFPHSSATAAAAAAAATADEPLSGISVFGDRCQELWQEAHGRLPPQLLDFITGRGRGVGCCNKHTPS